MFHKGSLENKKTMKFWEILLIRDKGSVELSKNLFEGGPGQVWLVNSLGWEIDEGSRKI